MENNQKSSRRSRLQSGSNSLLDLFKRHPWLFWSGVWVLLLSAAALISSIAILSLTHTGRTAHEEPQPTPIATENPAKTSQTNNVSSLWVLGAIALTCGAGYLVISKRLNSSSPRLAKPLKRSSARTPTRRQRRRRSLQGLPPVSTPPEPIPTVTSPVPADVEPVVTVLPPEEIRPLDSGEESLAEMMDIRKQRSLSSILGETFKKE